jgi:hypothetical protein
VAADEAGLELDRALGEGAGGRQLTQPTLELGALAPVPRQPRLPSAGMAVTSIVGSGFT